MWKIHGTTMWLEKLNILTNLSKSNRNYLLSYSYKGICTLYYLSSGLLIFLFYFLFYFGEIWLRKHKRELVVFWVSPLRFWDSVTAMAQWMTIGIKVGLAGGKKVTAKESSFMLNWLFSKSPETVVNQLREKDKIQESCTVQLSIKSIVQNFFP